MGEKERALESKDEVAEEYFSVMKVIKRYRITQSHIVIANNELGVEKCEDKQKSKLSVHNLLRQHEQEPTAWRTESTNFDSNQALMRYRRNEISDSEIRNDPREKETIRSVDGGEGRIPAAMKRDGEQKREKKRTQR